MLKKLLVVTLAVMLVFGLSGIGWGYCPPSCPAPDDGLGCAVDASYKLDVDVDIDIDVDVWDFGVSALNEICQYGDDNDVGDVVQLGGQNFSIITQDGNHNKVREVWQKNDGGAPNLSLITQDGNHNTVNDVHQDST